MSHSLLDLTARAHLLGLARYRVAAHLGVALAVVQAAHPKAAEVRRGCFVTLRRRDGDLRGCVGTFDDTVELWRNVELMALAAATRDLRFSPIEAAELADLRIEISALTPRRAAKPEEIQIGEHGLWLELQGRRGVLLPQVAVDHGWDAATFLSRTCLKAGLPDEAWRDPQARLEVFSAEVFDEPT